jgi:hypothetical protein
MSTPNSKEQPMASSYMSIAVCLLCLTGALNSSAQVTGEFKGVSFWATDGGRKFTAEGGSGALKNEKNETIAEGNLETIDEALAIKGKSGSVFVHEAKGDAFADDAFTKQEPKEFASLELRQGNLWTLKDAKFYFVLEVQNLNRPQIVPSLDRSLARASVIALPKGTVKLWGYSITVEKDTGTVKFAHGKIVEASDATYKYD